MSDEAGDVPGLDPAIDRVPPARPRWGRRSHVQLDAGVSGDRGGPTYAALDLGTNNCRLLVARPVGDGFRVIDAFSRIVRLGEGVSSSGRLSEPAIERTLGALAICRNKMRNRGVTRSRLIATEACRAAANGAKFRKRVAEELGLELEVIDRETEATLAATGCAPLTRYFSPNTIAGTPLGCCLRAIRTALPALGSGTAPGESPALVPRTPACSVHVGTRAWFETTHIGCLGVHRRGQHTQ
jgi:hypothetical protein